MKDKIIVSALLLALQPGMVNAGMVSTTVHSRANCVNNESITWYFNHSFNWKVYSIHWSIYKSEDHHIDTGFNLTWRQAAVHWGEGPLDDHRWTVSGFHYLADYGNGDIPFDKTYVSDCSIYNGWWDH